jgi:hypothetical protein
VPVGIDVGTEPPTTTVISLQDEIAALAEQKSLFNVEGAE